MLVGVEPSGWMVKLWVTEGLDVVGVAPHPQIVIKRTNKAKNFFMSLTDLEVGLLYRFALEAQIICVNQRHQLSHNLRQKPDGSSFNLLS